MSEGNKVGITTTVPVEIILAAGLTPVDLNNVFITSSEPAAMVGAAEARGFPPNVCAWIKGIYEAARRAGVSRVIGVTRGDCSSTEKLLEIWRHEGLETVPFAYPFEPDGEQLWAALEDLARRLETTIPAAEDIRRDLAPTRELLHVLDRMTCTDGKVTGAENHRWLVSASDFNGDPIKFRQDLETFLVRAEARTPAAEAVRLGYAGVPPIFTDLYEVVERAGGTVVFNEVQRQFAMVGDHLDLAGQYGAYTYPYDTAGRIRDLKRAIEGRRLRGILHYTQTFCHRQLESILLRETLPVPVLTLEADRPGEVDARTRTRLEAFIEQLREK